MARGVGDELMARGVWGVELMARGVGGSSDGERCGAWGARFSERWRVRVRYRPSQRQIG